MIALAATAGLVLWGVIVHRRRQARQWSKSSNNISSYTDHDEGELQLEEVDVNDDQPPASLSPKRGGAGMQDKEFI